MRLADRMEQLGTETAFEVLARARQLEREGRDVVHLEIGEPDFDTPRHVVDAAIAALREGYTHYGPSPGLPELREAIAAHVAATRGTRVGADQVVVTPGAKPIIFFTALALLQPGDEVIFPDPGFPIYESVVRLCGATPVALELREADDFVVDVERVASLLSPRTRMIVLNSPGNPTGGIMPAGQVEELAALLLDHRDVWVFTDEIYSRILYTGEHASILGTPGFESRTILLDGFSKAYAMTGWRLGYGVMPPALAAQVARLQTNSTSCTATFVQRAGLAALTGPQHESESMVAEFRRRRDVIVERLNSIPGISCRAPGGAFYAFPNVSRTGLGGPEMARRLLDEAGVACLSGTSFGRTGASFLRFSYANSVANIEAGMERVKGFVEANGRS